MIHILQYVLLSFVCLLTGYVVSSVLSEPTD
jgi:hypothetical protein